MALFRSINEISRAIFVSVCSTSTHGMQTFGRSEIRIKIFVHTAAFYTHKGFFVADIPARGTQYTTLAMNTFVSDLKYLCTLLYPNSSKGDFCKTSLSSVGMAAIPTPKWLLLSIFGYFLANYTIIYVIINQLNNFPVIIEVSFTISFHIKLM